METSCAFRCNNNINDDDDDDNDDDDHDNNNNNNNIIIIETQCMWNVKEKLIPVIRGATGTI